MKTLPECFSGFTLAAALAFAAQPAAAQVELRYLCYSDANECEVSRDLFDRFEAEHQDIRVTVEEVDYVHILNQLPKDLANGQGPDIARVTNLGGLNEFYLDLTPYIDRDYWVQNYGPTLGWMQSGEDDEGIYGWLTQLTVTGPYVNKTMFEEAGIPMPEKGATWYDWANAAQRVQDTLGVYAGIVMDRSGHRFAGAAISMGAEYFSAGGEPAIIDDGFKELAEAMMQWHYEGLMPQDIWPAIPGDGWKNGAQMFMDGDAVIHMSGSWMIQRYDAEIGDNFEWVAAPQPCGSAGCSGMPGGAAMVGFSQTDNPEAVAQVIDFMASESAAQEYYERTLQIPAHKGLAESGLDYGISTSKRATNALKSFTESTQALSPTAHQLQSSDVNFAIYGATVAHIADAIAGRQSLEDAYKNIEKDVANAAAQ